MSRRADQLLKAARAVAVPEAPALASVRQRAAESRLARRRRATLAVFVVALPLGATAAVSAFSHLVRPAPRLEVPAPSAGRGGARPPVAAPAAAPEAEVEAEPTAAEPVPPAPLEPSPKAAPTPRAVTAKGVTAPVPGDASNTAARGGSAARVAEPTTPEIPGPAVRSAAPAAVAASGGPPPPTALAEESALLSQALQRLRAAKEPERALELLEDYRRRFPRGTLRVEAALATVEAQRALGQSAEALAVLEGFLDGARTAELTVLRAELKAELSRCEDARAELARLTAPPELFERALFTQATCALVLGERDEAVRLLEALPESRRARALLEQLR